MLNRRDFGLVLFISLLCLQSGCGGGPSDMPELGSVSGTITLDGAPLEGAMVTFEPTSGRSSNATTDDQGQYTLQYTTASAGAKVGQHTVRIMRGGMMDELLDLEGEAELPGMPADSQPAAPKEPQLPARYHAESTLTADVKAGSNTFDFELKSGN